MNLAHQPGSYDTGYKRIVSRGSGHINKDYSIVIPELLTQASQEFIMVDIRNKYRTCLKYFSDELEKGNYF